MQKWCQSVDEVQKILPYNRARVQGAQGLHQAEAKIGLPTGLYTQLKKCHKCYGDLIYGLHT